MAFSSNETTYSSRSVLRNPVALFRDMWLDIMSSRELAFQLANRDIRARYRDSFLGILWSLAGPFGSALTFALLENQQILNVDTGEIPYPAFVLTSTILWSLFTGSLQGVLGEVRGAISIMTKVNVPKEAFLLSALYKLLFDVALRLIPLIIILAIAQVQLSATAPLVILGAITLVLLGMTTALVLLPLILLIDDLNRVLGIALSFAFFVTPVIYPARTEGILGFITRINPTVIPLETAREALLEGNFTDFNAFLWYLPILLVLLIFGLVIYRVSLPFIIERKS